MRFPSLVIVTALVAGLAPCTAAADSEGTIWLQFTGDAPAQSAYVEAPYVIGRFYAGVSNFDVLHGTVAEYYRGDFIGQYNYDPGGDRPPTGKGYTLWDSKRASGSWTLQGFCIDTIQFVPDSPVNYEIRPLAEAPRGGWPNLEMGQTKATELGKLYVAYWGQAGTPDGAAAFAAAAWEIVNEDNFAYNLGTGDFRVTPDQGTWDTTANGWLVSLPALVETSDALWAFVNLDTQDFAILIPGVDGSQTGTPVPEPLTVLTGLLALGGFGAYIRKHARSKPA